MLHQRSLRNPISMELQPSTQTQPQAPAQPPVRTSSLENQRRSTSAWRRLSEQAPLLPPVAEEDVSPVQSLKGTETRAATGDSNTNEVVLAVSGREESKAGGATAIPMPTLIPTPILKTTPCPISVAELPPTPSLHPSNRKKGVLTNLRQKASSVSIESLLGVPNKTFKGSGSHPPVKPPLKASKLLGLIATEEKGGARGEGRYSLSKQSARPDAVLFDDEGFDNGEEVMESVVSCRDLVRETIVSVDERITEWQLQRDEILGIVKDLQKSRLQETDPHSYGTKPKAAVNPKNVHIEGGETDGATDKRSESRSARDMVPLSDFHDLEELLLASDTENGTLETEKRALEKEVRCLRAENQGLKVQDERLTLTQKGLEAQNTRLNTENVRLEGEKEGLETTRKRLEDVVVEMYGFITARASSPPRPHAVPGPVSVPFPGHAKLQTSGSQVAVSPIDGSDYTERMVFGSVGRTVGEEPARKETRAMHIRDLIEAVDKELLNRCMGARTAELVESEGGVWWR